MMATEKANPLSTTFPRQEFLFEDETRQRTMGDVLLIIDVQKGFINESTKHIPHLVQELQMDYKRVYATRFYNEENSLYRTLIKWDKISLNSHEFSLAFIPGEHVTIVDKNIYSCISRKFLRGLQKIDAKVIDICGLETDICVTKCAIDLFEHKFIPRVLAKFCASCSGLEAHQHALKTLVRYIGKDQVLR